MQLRLSREVDPPMSPLTRRDDIQNSPRRQKSSVSSAEEGHSIHASRSNLGWRVLHADRTRSDHTHTPAIYPAGRAPKIGSNAFPCILLWRLLEAAIISRRQTDGQTDRRTRANCVGRQRARQNNPINKQ